MRNPLSKIPFGNSLENFPGISKTSNFSLLFPTPPLVSRKLAHVPLVRAINFQDFQLRRLCDGDPDPPTSQTDRRHAISRLLFALQTYSASRGNKQEQSRESTLTG